MVILFGIVFMLEILLTCADGFENATQGYEQTTSSGLSDTRQDFPIGLIGFNGGGPPFQLYRLGAAGVMAARDINGDDNILPNHTVTLTISYGGCNVKRALDDIVTLVRDVKVCKICSSSYVLRHPLL